MYLNQIQSYLITSTPIHIPLLSLSLSLSLSISLLRVMFIMLYMVTSVIFYLWGSVVFARLAHEIAQFQATDDWWDGVGRRIKLAEHAAREFITNNMSGQLKKPLDVHVMLVSMKSPSNCWHFCGSTSFLGENLGVSINVSAVNLMWSHVLVNGGAPAF